LRWVHVFAVSDARPVSACCILRLDRLILWPIIRLPGCLRLVSARQDGCQLLASRLLITVVSSVIWWHTAHLLLLSACILAAW
jgi:hypothetical protein